MNEVTEAAISQLLKADLVIRAPVVWRPRDSTDRRVRFDLPVANSFGEPLRLYMHVPIRIRWQYSIVLVWRNLPIWRLDIRGSHVNQCDGSGERWRHETHKHQWRDAYGDSWAYTPTDLLSTASRSVGHDEYRHMFESFCQECSIRIETSWVDPDFNGPFQDTIGGTA